MTSAPPTPPIKVAFIGLSTQGWASTTLAPSLTHPSLRSTYSLVAVSTTSPSSALQTAEKWSRELGHEVRAFHGDVESNLLRGAADTHWENESDNVKSDDDESKNDDSDNKLNNNNNAGKLPFDFDLAVISIRPLSHQPTLLPIIRSKKDFFIEWPVGRNSSETREIAAEAQRYGVRSIVGLQGRLGWAVNKAKEIIESGKIGKILSTNVVSTVQHPEYFTSMKTALTSFEQFKGRPLPPRTPPIRSRSESEPQRVPRE
ncbi:hypothetical protein CC2G_003538 [Coprinopsis cinerea AmutBmut pab1-1]|nr:hypothetical protein CC2G_003538 [Coprinopsis cinerea AmutBmut pab1-1]